MLRKIIVLFLILFLNINEIAFAINYNFTHYPASDFKINYNSNKGYRYLSYQGNTYCTLYKINISDIMYLMQDIKYFKSFKLSYYWTNTFIGIKNNNLNLTYLDNIKLSYPIISVFFRDFASFIIPQELLSQESIKVIGNLYQANNIKIIKYKNYYIMRLNKNLQTITVFDTKKFMPLFQSLYIKKNLLNLQIGQNYFDPYNIEGFTDNIIQIETLLNNKLSGLILSMDKYTQADTLENELEYGQDYIKDEFVLKSINELYDPILYYYQNMGQLPQDLGSMFPNFLDITKFNKYPDRKVFYEKTSYNCVKIYFMPQSEGFKKTFKNEISPSGNRYTQYCIF